MSELEIGSEFAGHRIEEVAGRGGMGVVYRAIHLALNRVVALKLIAPDLAEDADFQERFKRESQVAASIDHPHVIQIHHAGDEAGRLYITMRYCSDTDLREMIAAQGALDPKIAAQVVSQIGGALDAAHARGLIHRDVKPANILIEGDASNPHAYLTDFGLTRHQGSGGGLTKTGHWVGTLDYVAPEQIEGRDVDARADVYALGCVLYQALTGEIPYPRDTEVAKMWAHINDDPPSLLKRAGHLPPELEEVVSKSMAKKPGDRYLSAGDLGEAVKAAVSGREIVRPERSVATGSAAPASDPAGAGTAPAAIPGAAPTAAGGTAAPAQPAQPPAPAAPAGPPSGGPSAGKGRNPLLIGAAAVLGIAAIGGILAVAGVFGGGGGGGGDNGDGDEPVVEEPDTTAAESTLADFEQAWAQEDLAALQEGVLGEGADYHYLGDTPESVAAEYQEIFGTFQVTNYQLNVESVEPGEKEGSFEAKATYSYATPSADNPRNLLPFSGRLTFTLESVPAEDGGEPETRITAVRAIPDFVITWKVTDPPEVTDSIGRFHGQVVGETEITFDQKGTDYIPLEITDAAAAKIKAGDEIAVEAEWRGPTDGGVEQLQIQTPYGG